MMKYRRLGRSGLMVSEICLGTMTFSDPVSEKEADSILGGAIDLGINFVDTANCYEGYNRGAETAGGATEAMLGRLLKGRRDRIILATKVGSPLGPGHQERGLSAVHILRELEASLRRLQTDYIDLYIVHWPDKMVAREETLRAINTAVLQGKIRYFGVSNHSAWQVCEFLWLADKPDWLLKFDEYVFDKQEPVSKLAAELNVPMTHYALAWTLKMQSVTSLVIGVKSLAQLEDCVKAIDVEIPESHMQKIDRVFLPPLLTQYQRIRG